MSPFEHQRTKKQFFANILEKVDSSRTVVVLMSIVMVLIGVYVATTTAASGRGYTMRALEKNIKLAEHENQRLELLVANQTASREREARAKALGMISVDTIHYIDTSRAVVAQR